MSMIKEIMELVRELTALQSKVGDNADSMLRIESKVDSLLERLTKLEVHFEHIKESIKNELSAELKSDFTQMKTIWELHEKGHLTLPNKNKPNKSQ